jgi:exopolysaccharide biosynthesis polyprenyl glycosylphosphotransferase
MKFDIYKKNLYIPFLKMVSDITAITLAISFSYWLRFYSPLVIYVPTPRGFIPPYHSYFYFGLVLTLIYYVLFISARAYDSRIYSGFSEEIPSILKVSLLGILLGMSAAFLYRGFSYSRTVFLLIYFNSQLFLLFSRFLFHRLKNRLTRQGFTIVNTLLVGSAESLEKLAGHLQQARKHNFNVLGYLSEREIPVLAQPLLAGINELDTFLIKTKPDAVIVGFQQHESYRILDIIKSIEGKNIELYYMPDILELMTSHYTAVDLQGLLLLKLKSISLSGWQGFIKYIFDTIVSLVALLLSLPFWFIIAILVKVTSPGPVFYKQERIGLDGHRFFIWKFRTMKADAEQQTGPVWATAGDPRVFAVGRFLRRTSLDELPQLFNVLRGDMSLVGPRPERPHFVQQFRYLVPRYSERHRVRSGLTGWAQVNGLRGQSPVEERTKYDIYYIENWSLWFDLKIIILTFIAILKGENAY